MKKIEAILRPEKVSSVILALEGVGYWGVTVCEVAGRGKQRLASTTHSSADTEEVHLRSKMMLIVVIKDEDEDKVVSAIADTASTNVVGDGKIFVSNLSDCIRIRTKQRGHSAIN